MKITSQSLWMKQEVLLFCTQAENASPGCRPGLRLISRLHRVAINTSVRLFVRQSFVLGIPASVAADNPALMAGRCGAPDCR